MISLDIPCVLTYELQENKVVAYLKPTIPKEFDFGALQKILEVYLPSKFEREEEKEAFKKISDCLLDRIATKRVIKNE